MRRCELLEHEDKITSTYKVPKVIYANSGAHLLVIPNLWYSSIKYVDTVRVHNYDSPIFEGREHGRNPCMYITPLILAK